MTAGGKRAHHPAAGAVGGEHRRPPVRPPVRLGRRREWFAWTGFLLGAVLLIVVSFYDWIILVLPAWVAVVSFFILRRERARGRRA